jgi:hypothetical protein
MFPIYVSPALDTEDLPVQIVICSWHLSEIRREKFIFRVFGLHRVVICCLSLDLMAKLEHFLHPGKITFYVRTLSDHCQFDI